MCPSRSNAAVRSRSQAGKSPIAFLKPDFYMAAVFCGDPVACTAARRKDRTGQFLFVPEINYLPQARSMYDGGYYVGVGSCQFLVLCGLPPQLVAFLALGDAALRPK
jgi:hypothetical protein